SDIVVENYSPRVMEGWGLDWEEVHRINPRAIMVRAPAFGITGPWRDRTGYAQTMEMASGLAWMTGWADLPPERPNGPMDPLADGKLDRWVMISVESDDQWRRLCAVLDEPDLANEVLATAAGRRSAHDEIDDRLAKWCAGHSSDDVVDALVSAGVPAAKVLVQHEPRSVEQLTARSFWETVEHPVTGANTFPRYPVRLGDDPRRFNR